jgi:S1-C subfamily serine protease
MQGWKRRVALMVASFAAIAMADGALAQDKPASGSAEAPAGNTAAAVSAGGQRIFQDVRSRLLQVRTLLRDQDSQASVGSGFIVDSDGLAITNYHVVSQFALRPTRYRLSYTSADGRAGAVQLLAIDAVHDLALVRLAPPQDEPRATWPALTFRPTGEPLARGERIYSLGNPLDVGFAIVEGNFNGLVERSYLPQLFFAGSLNPGMSGGPALDASGRVIGVNVAARRDGEQVSFLVPAEFARVLLERGRSAAPMQGAAHAEISRQLRSHQSGLVERFIAQPWRSANHARYRVPVPQETFMRCWGSASPARDKHLTFERSDCVMDSAVFVDEALLTGTLTVRHEAYEGSKLGALRFARMYGDSFRNENFFAGRSATPPQCKERFVDSGGLPLRVVACLSALKRIEGLFNLSVLATSVDHSTQGVQGRLDVRGVDFAGAMKLVDHYLRGFGFIEAPAPTVKGR